MKKFSIILLIFINTTFFAQTTAPQLINYQGIARNPGGAPVVGQIGLKFELHQGNAGGTVVFTEQHSPTTNPFGIFNVQIGSVNQSQFAAIAWGAFDYFLEVSIDVLGGTSYATVGNQQLVSVPYALFAKNAGNSASYNAGSNITFTGPANNPTINSNPDLSLTGNVLNISGSGSPVTLPSVTLTATPNVTVSVPALNIIDLKVPNYVAGTNVTITPAAGNNFVIDAGTGTSTSVATPYSLSVNGPHSVTPGPLANLTIVAPNISVTGAGATVTGNILPNYSIHIPTVVVTPTTGGLSFTQNGNTSTVAVGGSGPWTNTGPVVHLVTGSNNVGIGTTNSTAKLTVTTNIAIDAILAQSSGANGILAQSISSNTTDAGVYGTNNGSGFGVKGETVSTSTTVAGVHGLNNGSGYGVIGITGSSNASISGVKGVNNNTGSGVLGVNTSSLNINSMHGVHGRTSSAALGSHGVFGENVAAGSGVHGLTSSTANNAYGVFGKNIGGGEGVRGETGASNTTVAAVSGFNNGTGVALKGSLPSASVAGSSNAALLLENGHIKTTSSSSAVSAFSVSFSQAGTHNIVPNAGNNDVRGVVTYTTNQTGPLAGAGTFVNINTTFSKIYSTPPVVVITSMNPNLQGWDLYLHQVNNSFFVVRAINNNGAAAPPPPNITFSYIVIE